MPRIQDDAARKAKKELKLYQKQAIQASHDLGYPYEVDRDIRKAKSEAEVSKIMAEARRMKWG